MHLKRTVEKEISCSSVGLHSGRKVNMTIKPAGFDDGIIFIRRDLSRNKVIKAELKNVCNTTLATNLGINGTRVATVEHLLSAFSGMGVANAVVEIDSSEIPIMDGSALPFVNMLKNAGTVAQGDHKRFLLVKKTIYVTEKDSWAMFMPYSGFKITYKIDFDHSAIGVQSYQMDFSNDVYEKDICPARTFGFIKDIEYLQAKGLALGGSLDNAIVLDDEKIINKGKLRFSDEFVKHKILDAIGDLFLLGMPIIGHFIAYKSGHRLNNLLIKKLLANEDSWTVISYFDREEKTEELVDFAACNVLPA